MKPYYSEDEISIYHGDCREILPEVWFGMDLLIADPPYPDYHCDLYQYSAGLLDAIRLLPCRQFVFWTTRVDFPLDWRARHVWDKRKGGAGSAYEFVYERNGSSEQWVWPFVSIQNEVRAQFARDEFTGHPSQKPWRLIVKMMELGDPQCVVDPFMGSGSTLVAAHNTGRRAIGIEIEERYCEIAAKRLSQGSLPLTVEAPTEPQGQSLWDDEGSAA